MTVHTVANIHSLLQEASVNHLVLSDTLEFTQTNNISNSFTAILFQEDGVHVAQCKQNPHIYGQGDTLEKALTSLLCGISDEYGLLEHEINLNPEITYED